MAQTAQVEGHQHGSGAEPTVPVGPGVNTPVAGASEARWEPTEGCR
jgi:hypothetical protein